MSSEKNDERTIYNLAYQDGKSGGVYVKQFARGRGYPRQGIQPDQRDKRLESNILYGKPQRGS